jgi:alpha-tubulin suppressor-like RCC1 family protein
LCASPRDPLPPYPEAQPLYHESFDEYYFTGETNNQLLINGFGFLDQSWSGYALECNSGSVVPFIIPALNADGQTNIASDLGGSMRWWVTPYWSSGSGPGASATLLELDAVNGVEAACAWTLQVSANGDTVALFTQTANGMQEVLQAPISWLAGTPHNLVLDFAPQGTALFLDGLLAAQGAGVSSIPLSLGQLVLGSDIYGTNTAGGDLEEFYSFNTWLSTTNVALYYGLNAVEAALGPIIAEQQVSGGPHLGGGMSSIYTPNNVYDPDTDTNGPVGGPFYITNVTATPQTNGTTTVSFAIFGGTNGVFYDIFGTTSLNNSLADAQWTWIGQGLTRNSYSFTNQPVGQSFYTLEMPAATMVVAFGSNPSNQCSVPFGITNAVAIAAGGYFSLALTNGRVIGWGDTNYGETKIPTGLSNVVSIAAGQFQGVALCANGSVTNWGWYGTSYTLGYCSVTNSSLASMPPTSNIVAIAAGLQQGLALTSNGTVVAWGADGGYGTYPTNLSNVSAIACGGQFNLALISNGTVTAWGSDFDGETQVPAGLTNVAAIAAGAEHSLALLSNGTVVAWGLSDEGQTNVPAGLTNVVAIAAGGYQSLALQANGTVVAWGEPSLTNVPSIAVGAKAISAGFEHSLVIESGLLTPIIYMQPTNEYALLHSNVTFSAQGQALAGVTYQWQSNGVSVTGATNATFTLTSVSASDNASYDVIVSTDAGSITSSVATFTLVTAPGVSTNTTPPLATAWINYAPTLTVAVTNPLAPNYPMSYTWQLNGTNLAETSSNYAIPNLNPTNDGAYTVTITNAVGSTSATWNIRLASPGMVEAWGDNSYDECDRPAALTNGAAIAAGEYQSIALTDSGTVSQWGQYWNGTNFYSVTNSSVAKLAPTSSNIVAVAAGLGQALAILSNGTVTNWGLIGGFGNSAPANLTNVQAITCGWQFNVALLNNGTVTAWSSNNPGLNTAITNVPTNMSTVIAIAAGPMHTLALQSNGKVVAWGYATNGETTVPTNCLSNVVAIAAGRFHSLALLTNGTVVAWGAGTSNNPADGYNFGQSMVPAGLSNVMAIAAGDFHSVALLNTNVLVEWGDNSDGQATVPIAITNVYTIGTSFPVQVTAPPILVKSIAAGGNHTMSTIFSTIVQYPVNVSKDLLLIYNTNSLDSFNVCWYYMDHRPMVSSANVLGIGGTTNETFLPADYTNIFAAQVTNWLAANPTKRPQYVILFPNIPSRVNVTTNIGVYNEGGSGIEFPSVQYQLNHWCLTNWNPFVTSINMNGIGGTNDCIGYINKIASIGATNSPGKLLISAYAGGYGNSHYYLDDTEVGYGGYLIGEPAQQALIEEGVSSNSIFYTNTIPDCGSLACHLTTGSHLAGYLCWGAHSSLGASYATNATVNWTGNSGWYIMATIESFNGQRSGGQGNFLSWYAANAFGGANYSNTPVAAISNVDEPGLASGNYGAIYFGLWANGLSSAICAWNDVNSFYFQAVGDPFVTR